MEIFAEANGDDQHRSSSWKSSYRCAARHVASVGHAVPGAREAIGELANLRAART